MIRPVILSGGSGTRLWPLSTPDRPKQFLPLIGEGSLFRDTVRRVEGKPNYDAPVVVANALHLSLCTKALADSPRAQLILEPVSRNTAVAIVMAAHVIAEREPDAVMLVMPSDHRIEDEKSFHGAVELGAQAARAGRLVTFGIEPTRPETGFGYLHAVSSDAFPDGVLAVERFKEKPDADSARAALSAGDHYWNAGIFMFRADRFLTECARVAPEVHGAGLAAVDGGTREGPILRPAPEALCQCPNISVDHAVMEPAQSIVMVPLDAGWSDLGSWDALADLSADQADAATTIDSSNCYVKTDGVKVALLGVEDLIVVGRGNQIAIMRRGRSHDIKRLAALAASY